VPQGRRDRGGHPNGGLPAGWPPYSPDLNPIENAFSKLKRLLRDWAARTTGGIYEALRQISPRFQPAECRNDFRHCGYQPATAA